MSRRRVSMKIVVERVTAILKILYLFPSLWFSFGYAKLNLKNIGLKNTSRVLIFVDNRSPGVAIVTVNHLKTCKV